MKTVSRTAERAGRAPGAPRYSDVCFFARIRRPAHAEDIHDTFRDAKMRLVERPTMIKAAGNPPKAIQEFIGRVSTDTTDSIQGREGCHGP